MKTDLREFTQYEYDNLNFLVKFFFREFKPCFA